MRTKSILLAAATLAAGALSSQAQSNVYSVNVVGYVNVPLTNGFNMISNPLDKDGTGTNNNLTSVFGNNLPSGSQVYKFAGGTFSQTDAYITGPGWLGGGTISLNPGEGIFVQSAGNVVITMAGTVLQGNLVNPLVSGFNIRSSKAAVSGALQGQLNYQPSSGDQIYFWDPASQTYATTFAYITGPGWLPSDPTVNIGQAFFINAAATNTWTTNFVVQ